MREAEHLGLRVGVEVGDLREAGFDARGDVERRAVVVKRRVAEHDLEVTVVVEVGEGGGWTERVSSVGRWSRGATSAHTSRLA
ncbi:hypothetical protein [Nannocystis sp.]|uniref:hypothetical protein n=1 Tax=Nannocystis sp. TaxID=1962667 RepID=UPI0024299633|nr:hypothetical protein [Nannocystis sp.]MBK7824986.1 hypothetical protein [Nannocystis sp.]MBK9752767.1 hypothetical protein [Nannocystis sp.]